MDFDIESFGYSLLIIDVKATHRGLNDQYSALTEDMNKVSRFFGKSSLREVDEQAFYENIPELRRYAGERAILRSMHVFEENKRVDAEEQAIKNSDFKEFLRLVNESGLSSELYLQNITPESAGGAQPMALALAICRRILDDCGAVRFMEADSAAQYRHVPIDRKSLKKDRRMSGRKNLYRSVYQGEGCTIIN